MIFEIYLSGSNTPCTNIELPRSWSFYPSEQEVLLLPFFCFQVLSVTYHKDTNTTIIKVIEIPYQNLLAIRPISLSRVIWIDPNVHNSENHKYRLKFEDNFKNIGFSYATEIDEAVSQINSTVKTVLITSGAIGMVLMPKIHHLQNVMVVLVFCQDTVGHSKWAKDFDKVKGVVSQFSQAVELSKKLLSDVMKN